MEHGQLELIRCYGNTYVLCSEIRIIQVRPTPAALLILCFLSAAAKVRHLLLSSHLNFNVDFVKLPATSLPRAITLNKPNHFRHTCWVYIFPITTIIRQFINVCFFNTWFRFPIRESQALHRDVVILLLLSLSDMFLMREWQGSLGFRWRAVFRDLMVWSFRFYCPICRRKTCEARSLSAILSKSSSIDRRWHQSQTS